MGNYLNILDNKPAIDETLSNGLHLLIKEDRSASLCSVQFLVKSGSIHEENWLGSGISHFLEHMLFKGTKKRECTAISKEIETLGGTVNAYTTFDRTVYYINGPSEALLAFTDILRDMIFHATIPDSAFDSERDVIFREINMLKDDPDQELSQTCFETIFRHHPYQLPIIGHKDLFSKIRRSDLWDFYKKHYIPNNMILSIVTDKIETEHLSYLKESLAVYPMGFSPRYPIESEPIQTVRRKVQIRKQVQTTRGIIGYRIPNMRSIENPSLQILGLILGKGEQGILNQEMRKVQKKVTEIDCSIWNSGSEGVAFISYTADHEDVNEIEGSIENLWHDLEKRRFSKMILDRAKRQLTVAVVNSYKTFSGQAGQIALNQYWHGTQEGVKKFFQEIGKVDEAKVKSALQRYFINGKGNFVSLIPKNNAAKELALVTKNLPHCNPTEHQLSNGIKVVLLEKKGLPKLNIKANFFAGAILEAPTKRGLSSLMTHLLCFDAGGNNADEVSNKIESVGGVFSEFTGNHTYGLVSEVLNEDWEIAIDLMSSGIIYPQFQKTTYELEKKGHLAQIKEEDDDIFYYGLKRVRKNFFGNHPLSSNPDGDSETVSNISLLDCKNHWNNIICGENLVISATGDFNSKDILTKLEERFSNLKVGKSVKQEYPLAVLRNSENKTYSMNREQTVYFLSFSDVGLLNENNYLGIVLHQILNGMSSHLFESIREEKGLAYYLGSMRTIGLDCGMFTFYAGTNRKNLEAVRMEFSREIDRIRSGKLSNNELIGALKQLDVIRRNKAHSIAFQSTEMGSNLLHGLATEHWKVVDKKIQETSIKELTDFVQEHWQGEGVSLVCGDT